MPEVSQASRRLSLRESGNRGTGRTDQHAYQYFDAPTLRMCQEAFVIRMDPHSAKLLRTLDVRYKVKVEKLNPSIG